MLNNLGRIFLFFNVVAIFSICSSEGKPVILKESLLEIYSDWPFSKAIAQKKQMEISKIFNLKINDIIEIGNGVFIELILVPPGSFFMGSPEPQKPILSLVIFFLSIIGSFALFVFGFLKNFRQCKENKHIRFNFCLRSLLIQFIFFSFAVFGGIGWLQGMENIKEIRANEMPFHEVIISRPFYLGKFEVTIEQWEQVMLKNPCNEKIKKKPVVCVSWFDAVDFCMTLNKLTGVQSRLPTEAEWEYACRGGSEAKFCFGDNLTSLKFFGWFFDNSKDQIHVVGQKECNSFGIFDMHGNVWEWCQDWYKEYPKGKVVDPKGPITGEFKVTRGGSSFDQGRFCRCAQRMQYARGDRLGFRIVVDALSLKYKNF